MDQNTMLNQIIAYEDGELDEESTVALFAELIATGRAWQLQGHYGRQARDFIEAGLISADGVIQ